MNIIILTKYTYLHLTLWVGLTAVFTFSDSPLARDRNVLVKMFHLHCRLTVFVCTWYEFEKATCQVNLFQK